MDRRDEALKRLGLIIDLETAQKLLRSGHTGVEKWNRYRGEDKLISDLRGIELVSADLRGADFRKIDLSQANLRNADLSKARFSEANLSGASLRDVNISSVNLSNATLSNADLSGAKASKADLRNTDLSEANLSRGDFSFANFKNSKLVKANIENADLRQADLRACNLRHANLSDSNMSKAILDHCNLRQTNMCRVNLSSASLIRAKANGVYLSQADLRKSDLSGIDLSGSDLSGANLGEANLTRAMLIECDLTDALIEKSIVEAIHIYDLKGIPRPPEILYRDAKRKILLEGEDARTFFKEIAIVEVYLTEPLTQEEVACFHLHLAEMHKIRAGKNVYLSSHRYEGPGSVLRFEAPFYNEIYDAIFDLLAPFLMTQAIDWRRTIQHLSSEERSEAITALVKLETQTARGIWRFAERMHEIFRGYRNSRVYEIKEGTKRGIRVDIFTNDQIADRLLLASLPVMWDGKRGLSITTGHNSNIQIVQGDQMGDKYIVGQAGAVGPQSHTQNTTLNQIWNQIESSIDLTQLANDLSALYKIMKQEATSPEHEMAVNEVAKAEQAARAENGASAVGHLKSAGKWALDFATKIGARVAEEVIKNAMNIK
jgi:uncharacterized protein YjbI with pentapeptide repeats